MKNNFYILSFSDVFTDVTRHAKKIPVTNYLSDGVYPIFDQSKKYISGYYNQDSDVFFDVPAIIFGDHTRIRKYVDVPCFIGADGVKLLKGKIESNPKYLFYALSSINIPNTGYNRHFKLLKEAFFKIRPIEIQNKIVKELDLINIIKNRKLQQLAKLDELAKSRFLEMFGDVKHSTKYSSIKLKEICKTLSGGTPTTKHPEYYTGNIPWITTVQLGENYISGENPKAFITEEAIKNSATHLIPANNILFGTRVGVGKSSINTAPICTNQDINVIMNIDETKWDLLFIKLVLDHYQDYFDNIKKGATIKGITIEELTNIDIPMVPICLQKEYSSFIEQLDKSKFRVKKCLKIWGFLRHL